jgi:hypothetical protein
MGLEIKNLDKPLKKQKNKIHPELPGGDGKQFMWAIIGSRGSGKSNMLLNILTRKEMYKDQFVPKYLFFFSPSLGVDHNLEQIKGKYMFPKYDEEIVDKIIEVQKSIITKYGKSRAPHLLMVYDDCINESVFNHNSWLEKLAYTGRHLKISCIFTSQRYKALPRGLRLNCSQFSIFPLNNSSEFDQIVEEHSNKHNRDKFIKMFNHATAEMYNFCHIDYSAPKDKKYRKNFNEFLQLDEK